MTNLIRPLVLIHGLWNTPKLFDNLLLRLHQPQTLLLVPHLPHDLGRISIRKLAIDLDFYIKNKFGENIPIDLLGFSMGGLIGRVWLQEMGGYKRTCRFFSIGSPHNGTLTAQFVPNLLFSGIADMKIGSDLIKSLDNSLGYLQNIRCTSFYTYFDLMVFPSYNSILPLGTSIPVPVLTHKSLIRSSKSVELISTSLLDLGD